VAKQKLIVGNWKMNGLKAALSEAATLAQSFKDRPSEHLQLVICPPATLLASMAEMLTGSQIQAGGQDCHVNVSGAHTGDISAAMLADIGARYVIVGHSERRSDHGETDQIVQSKAKVAIKAHITPIICVGETQDVRDSGGAIAFVLEQIRKSIPEDCGPDQFVIAYEPVWAIGTGRIPSSQDVEEMHAAIRAALNTAFGLDNGGIIPVLYGGSVNPENAASLLSIANVDGALVGGASLKADSFLAIMQSAQP
jgi:triosephosphate isomerase (TIM)